MRTVVRPLLVASTLLAIVVVTIAVLAWRPTIAAIAPPAHDAFDAALAARGARLAAVGNCAGCHTVDGGSPFAGGVALATPFGTIFGTNVTPDVETGIGAWSEAAFARALRAGVDREGRHLYPAFPYDHFTRLADDDVHALYAFFMTRDPVAMTPPENDLMWPLRWRALVAGWNLLFLDRSRSTSVALLPSASAAASVDKATIAATAHGAYLVDALAHCGACHTPRNALGAEERDRAFAGGMAEGWYAPPLNADSPSPIPWTVDALTTYLRTGLVADHAMAGGPMQGVVASLADADEADVRAIAATVVASMGAPSPERTQRAEVARARAATPLASRDPREDDATMRLGATVHATACARCHDAGRAIGSGGALQLPFAVALYDSDPKSFLRIVREGIRPRDTTTGRWMPAFGTSLTDEQLAALAAWLRRVAADAPPWPDLAKAVAATASERR